MAAHTHAARVRSAPRRRPSARPDGPRSSASRIRWDRLGRIALTLVLAVIAISYFRPVLNLVTTYRGTASARTDLRSLERESNQLKRRLSAASDPVVLEREARRQGLVVPEERPYVIHGLSG